MSTEDIEAQAVLDGLNPPWHVLEDEYVSDVAAVAAVDIDITFAFSMVNASGGVAWVGAIMPGRSLHLNNLIMTSYGVIKGPFRFVSPYDVIVQFTTIKEIDDGRPGGGFRSIADLMNTLNTPSYETRHGYLTLKGDPSLRPYGIR